MKRKIIWMKLLKNKICIDDFSMDGWLFRLNAEGIVRRKKILLMKYQANMNVFSLSRIHLKNLSSCVCRKWVVGLFENSNTLIINWW